MRRAFSMVEVLVVVAILVVLAGLAVPAYRAVRQRSQVQAAEALLDQLKLAIEAYANDHGDPPPSDFRRLRVAAATGPNEGIEALVLCLRARGKSGVYFEFAPEQVANVDDDTTGGRPLEEVVDPWGSPLVYLHNRAYDGGAQVSLPLGGEAHVRAAKDDDGQFRGLTTYQLWSAGPDREAGTDDDLRAWGE